MTRTDWRLLKPWLKQLNNYRLQLLLGVTLALVTALFGIGLLSLSGWFITAAALYVGFDIYTPGAGIRFFAIGRTLSRYLERLLNHDLVLKLQARWRVALYRLLQTTPLEKNLNFRVSDTVQQLTRNLDAMDNLLIRLLMPVIVFTLASALLLVLWSLYSPWLSLLLLLGALLIAGSCAWLAFKSRSLAVKSLVTQQRLRSGAMNLADSAAELIAWSGFNQQSASLLNNARSLENLEVKGWRYQQLAQWVTELITQLVLLLVFFVTLTQIEQQHIGAAEVIMLVLSVLAWQELAAELPGQWLNYGKTLAAARQLLNPAVTGTAPSHHAKQQQQLSIPIMVELKDISIWREQRLLLQHLHVTFEAGRVHWIEGASGKGKSTLAEVLMGMLPAQQWRGQVITQPRVNLPEVTAYLTQETEILDGSIKENLNPGRQPIADQRYWQVLRCVNLSEKVRALPAGLSTLIGPRGIQLSGGQLRRLALARVLLQDKPVMILDEPFAGIERSLVEKILERMVSEFSDKTWIIISHLSVQAIQPEIPIGVHLKL
ncbi:amino acid ABC transporter ATP-binding/permease protein [Idiomarina seosinensis]|uniref:Thiol reductant ABC exporter subunit CydC n=1 Tax=Idiomarina seosinensis TaxID=281739 RepID=A0A432ZBB5_9GAMM|nr:ATP-binding cassette domain-containing protein [Idiomarina seosinensis]RUO75246.1 hypothetical protein CWI81_09705 [Idiomarina seosinensis]